MGLMVSVRFTQMPLLLPCMYYHRLKSRSLPSRLLILRFSVDSIPSALTKPPFFSFTSSRLPLLGKQLGHKLVDHAG